MKSELVAKFQQNKDLMKFLKDIGNTKLVKVNPHDQYWGVGLDIHDSKFWYEKLGLEKHSGKTFEECKRWNLAEYYLLTYEHIYNIFNQYKSYYL